MKTIKKILRNTYVEIGLASSIAVFLCTMIYHYAGTVKDTQANASAITEMKMEQGEDRKVINEKLDKIRDSQDEMGRDISRMKGILEHK